MAVKKDRVPATHVKLVLKSLNSMIDAQEVKFGSGYSWAKWVEEIADTIKKEKKKKVSTSRSFLAVQRAKTSLENSLQQFFKEHKIRDGDDVDPYTSSYDDDELINSASSAIETIIRNYIEVHREKLRDIRRKVMSLGSQSLESTRADFIATQQTIEFEINQLDVEATAYFEALKPEPKAVVPEKERVKHIMESL